MVQVVFKNMEASTLAKNVIQERVSHILKKFPTLVGHKITLTLEMYNSPKQSGPDLYAANVLVTGKTFKSIRLKKTSENFYQAIAVLMDRFIYTVSRNNDRRSQMTKKKKHKDGGAVYE